MKLRIIWAGKTKNPHVAGLCKDYISRIRRFIVLEIVEVKQSRMMAALDSSDRVVVLDPGGKSWTSAQLAKFIEDHMTNNPRRLTFVVGDYAGLTADVKELADVEWSLSPMTLTHDLTRVFLLEQIYRALTIIRNIPYSK